MYNIVYIPHCISRRSRIADVANEIPHTGMFAFGKNLLHFVLLHFVSAENNQSAGSVVT